MQLFFEQIIDKEGCMSYIIGCPESKEAAVVDANHNINSYIDLLKKHDMKLKYIIDTHTHADHNSLAGELATLTGSKIAMHSNYSEQRRLGANFSKNKEVASHLSFNASIPVDIALEHQDVLKVGNILISIIQTPGHTTDSICLMLPERLILTGDSLMIGQCGRPDLPGGSSGTLFDSIFGILLKLDDNTIVCPGHDYRCNVSTTIGYERVNNPFLKNTTREQFTAYTDKVFSGGITEGKLQCSASLEEPDTSLSTGTLSPMASRMCSAVEYYLRSVPTHWNLIEAEDLYNEINENREIFLLDVRTPEEFASGSIPGSVNIPVTDLPGRIKELPEDYERYIVTICRSGSRSAYALMFLRGYGYSHVRSLDLGIYQWAVKGYPVSQNKSA